MTELTIAIATCGRPRILRRCLTSIKKFVDMPVKVIVLDNTRAFTDKVRTAWIEEKVDTYIPVDDKKIGCCESNQMMVDVCDTPYIMHMDDDIYLTKKNTVERIFDMTDTTGGITSCIWNDTYYKGYREAAIKHCIGWKGDQKLFWKVPIPIQAYQQFGMTQVESDEALHSMVIDMQVYDNVKWDPNYAWKGDREDFFLQCKQHQVPVNIRLDVEVTHDPQPFQYGSVSYNNFDGKAAIEYFTNKWNMIPVFPWDGPQMKPGNPNI